MLFSLLTLNHFVVVSFQWCTVFSSEFMRGVEHVCVLLSCDEYIFLKSTPIVQDYAHKWVSSFRFFLCCWCGFSVQRCTVDEMHMFCYFIDMRVCVLHVVLKHFGETLISPFLVLFSPSYYFKTCPTQYCLYRGPYFVFFLKVAVWSRHGTTHCLKYWWPQHDESRKVSGQDYITLKYPRNIAHLLLSNYSTLFNCPVVHLFSPGSVSVYVQAHW